MRALLALGLVALERVVLTGAAVAAWPVEDLVERADRRLERRRSVYRPNG